MDRVVESRPEPVEGVNLVEGERVFQSLLDRGLSGRDEEALWIDAGNEASTYLLGSFNTGLLEKVRIARCFTAFQHRRAIGKLESWLSGEAFLVLSDFDRLYTDLKDWEQEQLLIEAWNAVLELQEGHGLKVLVSASSSFVEADADRRISAQDFSVGRRFDADGFRQPGYSVPGGVQTTVPLWTENRRTEKKRVLHG